MQKHKTISDSEQERMNMIGKRKINAMLTPMVLDTAIHAWRAAA
jgi:hypothetical protein